jgi:hypothetical protein
METKHWLRHHEHRKLFLTHMNLDRKVLIPVLELRTFFT